MAVGRTSWRLLLTGNAEVCAALRAAGHEVFLPQEQEPGNDGPGIFEADVGGIDWADGLVAIMDGPDPDSGTAWEVGYAFGTKKPIVLVRTDFRALAGIAGDYLGVPGALGRREQWSGEIRLHHASIADGRAPTTVTVSSQPLAIVRLIRWSE